MKHIWDREHDAVTGRQEPDAAFRWFTVYRDLGPGRTLEAVTSIMRAEAARRKVPASTTLPYSAASTAGTDSVKRRRASLSGPIAEYSARWDWVKRSRAWDDHKDQLAL